MFYIFYIYIYNIYCELLPHIYIYIYIYLPGSHRRCSQVRRCMSTLKTYNQATAIVTAQAIPFLIRIAPWTLASARYINICRTLPATCRTVYV